VDSLPAPPEESSEYPYWLISPHPQTSIHSQIADVAEKRIPDVFISPGTGEACGLAAGDIAEVRTSGGALKCRVVVGNGVRDDTVLIYEGSWDRLGGSVNRLTPDTLSDGGTSATYYDVRCSLTRSG
jgi:anaerobic selenocysteine-containing dehydrogenase